MRCNYLILLLLMLAVGAPKSLLASQTPVSEDACDVISLPEQSTILWEDLGLCDVIASSSTVVASPSATSRLAHRTHSSNSSVRTLHSYLDEFPISASFIILKSQYSSWLALPFRSVDYYVYTLSRLRC